MNRLHCPIAACRKSLDWKTGKKYCLYKDALSVDDAQALFSYIMSCHGNQMDMLSERMEEFKSFIETKIEQNGAIYITKEAGVFVCEK